MDWVFLGLLFLHVMGAIVAFGPTFSFPLIGSMSGKEPQHGNFALRAQERISDRIILPLAIFQIITGVGLLWRLDWTPLTKAWLLVALALYAWALAQSLFILRPTVHKLVEATSAPPPLPPVGAAPPSGPPPHVAAMIRRARTVGMVNAVLIVTIVFLMVTKPFA
jgi:uncharacterized membrane protein